MEFDGGLVTVHADEFTDEYDFTAIRIGSLDRNEGEVAVLDVDHRYAVMFRAHSASDAEQMTIRIDRTPAVTNPRIWVVDEDLCFAIESDLFLDLLIGTERLIYRIGDDGETLEVSNSGGYR